MSSAEFSVRFDGPALENHSMQVRDLAPALLALGESMNALAALAEPTAELPSLAIKATGEGSFVVLLQLADASTFHRLQDFLVGDAVTAVLNAKELLVAFGGAYAAVKWLRRRRIKTVEVDKPRPGYVRITDERGDSIEVPSDSWTAAQDVRFREAARDAIAPLNSDGIETVEIIPETKIAGAQAVSIGREDRDAFEVPPTRETIILDTDYETVLRLVSIAFNDQHKWRVSEGDVTFWVQIEDLGFLERVSRGVESFTAGDLLRVRLRHQQWSTDEGPRSDRAVLSVLQHIPGPRQVSLPFADSGDADE